MHAVLRGQCVNFLATVVQSLEETPLEPREVRVVAEERSWQLFVIADEDDFLWTHVDHRHQTHQLRGLTGFVNNQILDEFTPGFTISSQEISDFLSASRRQGCE